MKVICAGLQKTGTKSISKALRHLGFTVFDWEEQIFPFLDHWFDVFQNGAQPDVKRVYHNADAIVDIPGNFFWEEILNAFPDCKLILSEREEDSWVRSFVNQLESFEKNDHLTSRTHMLLSETSRKFSDVAWPCYNALFGSTNPKSTCVFRKRYRIHNHRVKTIVPPERLLEYNVKQGWKPLCEFLGCDVPTFAFPHENIKGEIATSLKELAIGRQVSLEVHRAIFVLLSLIGVAAAALFLICFY